MRRWSPIVVLMLAAALSLSVVATAGAAPKHDKTIFKKRFLLQNEGKYFGKRLDMGSGWKVAGRDLGFWSEIHFKDDASGRFDLTAETTWDESDPSVPQATLVGTGRVYVTKKTIVFKFKSSGHKWFKRATKRIVSGKKYYYNYKPGAGKYSNSRLRLYKTKSTFYRSFNIGVWG